MVELNLTIYALFFISQQQNRFYTQVRDGQQITSSSRTPTIEGDIIVRDGTPGDRAGLSAPLADPDRLWPGIVVKYHFFLLYIFF